MKRSRFLSGMLLLPVTTFADWNDDRKKKGFKIKKGEGRFHGHITLKSINVNVLDVKVSGKDTNGDLAIFEQTGFSYRRGTPMHIHPDQDEIFYVLEGEYQFQVGDEKFKLTEGDSIFLPRKVPHSWIQMKEKGKLTVIVQPAGKLEEFFVTMAALNKEPSKSEINRIFSDHEMEVTGPPMQIDDTL